MNRITQYNVTLSPFYFLINEVELAPVFLSAEVGSVADNIVVMSYDSSLSPDIIPATTDYVVTGGGETFMLDGDGNVVLDGSGSPVLMVSNAVTNVSVSSTTVILTLTRNIEFGDNVVLSYISGANPLQGVGGGQCEDLAEEAVTNNIEL